MNTYNSTTTYSLTGNTNYDYAVRGVNGSGDGAWSATSTVLTEPDIPGTPTFSALTDTTVTVSWTAPTGGAATYKLARCTGAACTDFTNIQTGIAGLSFGDSALSLAGGIPLDHCRVQYPSGAWDKTSRSETDFI